MARTQNWVRFADFRRWKLRWRTCNRL